MKKLFSINAVLLSFFLPVIIISRQEFQANREETIKIAVRSVTRSNRTQANGTEAVVTSWNADASRAQIKFDVKGPFGTVHGKLSGLRSTIRFDEDNLAASSFRASVDPKSISTGIGLRNRDLQKEKFFDSDNHPIISFQSDKIQKSGNGYNAIGSLTIKGVTKQVQIPFTFTEKGNSGLFHGNFTIHREDFGVGKKGGTVGNDVDVTLDVPVTKSK